MWILLSYVDVVAVSFSFLYPAPMLVGYEMSEYKTPAKTEREVELCAVVAGGSAVRPFTLQAYPPSGSRGTYTKYYCSAYILCIFEGMARHKELQVIIATYIYLTNYCYMFVIEYREE